MTNAQLETLKAQLNINHNAWQAFMEHSEHADAGDYTEQIGQNFALNAIRYILDGDFEKGMGILRVIRNKTGLAKGWAIEKAEEKAKELRATGDLAEGGDA
jgi:hypothetical protein